MGLFDTPEELERRAKLKALEDKRLTFVQEAKRRGFHPDRMLLASGQESQLIGLAKQDGAYYLVVAPAFGAEGDYTLTRMEALDYAVEEHYVRPEGMGGVMGLGKKGEMGIRIIIHTQNGDVTLPLIAGLNTAQFYGRKNPLFDEKRRRGDANVVWDLPPMDKRAMEKIVKEAEKAFGIRNAEFGVRN